jgi:DNA-binding response OmpR family regulator
MFENRIGTLMPLNNGPRHGGRVLVCDDNLLIADVVAEFLRECGFIPIGPVGRLESAMQMARERALDGAILDINLNGRPCFPICAILSARRIPFMFLTGYPQASIPVEYRWAPLIAKPFEPNEMKEALADMLGLAEDWSSPEHLGSGVRH